MTARCKLCGEVRPLLLSHVVPHFVWRWLKASSPTKHFRSSVAPNLRIQDGWKARLLCAECEQLLMKDEKIFAERVFMPMHENRLQPFHYGPWALRFAISVLWRTVVFSEAAALKKLKTQHFTYLQRAERAWRDFLLGKRRHPGSFHALLFPLDTISKSILPKQSAFLNRYLLRTVDIDILDGTTDVIVYAKLARTLLIGHVEVRHTNRWRRGRLSARGGLIGGRVTYTMPEEFFEYLNKHADLGAEAFKQMSPIQKEKLKASLMLNVDGVADSEVIRAMTADVEYSGNEAFRVTKASAENQ